MRIGIDDEASLYQMKRQRLAEDGRLDELQRRVRERMKEQGLEPDIKDGPNIAKIYREVMDAMLPDGEGTTIEWYRDRVIELDRLKEEKLALERLEAERIESRKTEFEFVFEELPTEASAGDVMSWIENHAAMNLREEGYELVADDIRDAPSRAAVGNLRHWLDHKQEFYKSWMQRAKAGGGFSGGGSSDVHEDEEVSEEVSDPGIAEISKMMGEMASRAKSG
ncbi:MAG: hypothetical protein AAFV88_04320 [Planctomycetota bacterium]